ncbi:sigma-70 family RNA polymerase sigma factor [Bacillus sp. CECT 9360]|uniref:sigma-70 family RNA polymerase sigma factor n=1 Tax=Bacillus sp. CECT 9360 TaxID=2845821 RepID=UPI001E615139|nr:sigma-70 family RNA polymerase sigma factor [Bacillus sp. CECT 9360]CAH0345881.1 RNA polymerase sigma factor SigI [Bacillus sp. CECT 9360]
MEDFSKLADQYSPMIHKIIRTLSIYKNKEEFFQIGLIALWEAQTKFDPTKGSFLNFAYLIVKGRMLNELRKENRYDSRNKSFEIESIDISTKVMVRDEPFLIENLQFYCEGLTRNQAHWLILTFQEERSHSEIAEQLGVSVAAVKSWRQSALKKLRKKAAEFLV